MSKIIFVVIVTLVLSCKSSYTKTAQEKVRQLELKNTIATPELRVMYNADSTTVKFIGIVTNEDNSCWRDASCKIEVNHKWWLTVKYGRRSRSFWLKERGKSMGIRFTKDNESIGKKVTVYAKIKNQNKLTLEGSKEYYVKTIE